MRTIVIKNIVCQAVDAVENHSLISSKKIFDKRDKKEDRAKSWSEEIQYIEKGKGLVEQRDTGHIKEPRIIDIYSTFYI